MINFYRKIRQRLLVENRFSKYFLYTIGEIVLVVIGILIALAINSKMDQYKKQESSKVILKALHQDIANDLNSLNSYWTQRHNEQTAARNRLEAFIEGESPISDSFQFVTDIMLLSDYTTFDHNKTSMEDLINTGRLELIQNEQLRKALLKYKAAVENISEFDILHRAYFLETFGRLGPKIVDGLALPRSFLAYHQLDTVNTKNLANQVLNSADIRSSDHLREFLVATGHPFYIKKNRYSALKSEASKLLKLLDEALNENN